MNQNYFDGVMDDVLVRTFMMPAVMPNTYNNSNNNNNMYNNMTFLNSNEGFLRGNMEANSYIPYKNMTYIKPSISNEKMSHLYKIQELAFAAHDINLYLDMHPNDTNAINLYNNYNTEAKRLTLDYEKKYGPIDLSFDEGLSMTPWSWINEPWPWNE